MDDILTYNKTMDEIHSDIKDEIFDLYFEFRDKKVNDIDILNSLKKENLTRYDLFNLLSDEAMTYIEEMAEKAKLKRIQYFGKNVNIFSPLYISNYCSNGCKYCGFGIGSDIDRVHLNMEEIEAEMICLKEEGIEDVLILTGEAPLRSSISYIGDAVKLARRYFRIVGLEIYPANVDDYKYLHKCGADYVTIFQETYQQKEYDFFHPSGNKRKMLYRMESQERALLGNMRGVGFGCLFGLADPIMDSFLLACHASLIQQKYPHGEIAISLPRIRPSKGVDDSQFNLISDKKLFQIMLAMRLYLPYASITISTRESREFRDLAIQYGATKVSASVSTGVGERKKYNKSDIEDEQFEINDHRSYSEIDKDFSAMGYTTVLSDYIFL